MTYIDGLVVICYLAVVTAIGVMASRRVTSSASFFISDRGFGKFFMTFLQFGAGTQADQAVSVASKTFTNGLSGIWYQWLWLPVTPFYWIIAAIIRRWRAVTTADYFERRYSQSVATLYVVLGLLQLIASTGLMLKGSAVTIEAVSGNQIQEEWAILGMSVLFVLYGVAGGLSAAILTDFIQGILTLVLSFLILPFALYQVHGLSSIRQSVANPGEFLSIVAPGDISTFYVVVLSLNALVGFITSPIAILSGAGQTEMQSRIGLVAGSLMKRICTVAWTFTGLCAVVLYAGQEVDPDFVFGRMANDVLPLVAPGLLGLFIASLLAATMSSCDATMVCAAGLFTRNLYKPLFQPSREDRHYILVGRISSVVVVAISLFWAFQLSSVIKGLELFWEISAVMGVAAWMGLFWRRATVAGAWAGSLTTLIVWLVAQDIDLFTMRWSFNDTIAPILPSSVLQNGALYKPWHMLAYLTSGFAAMVVVSLLGPQDENGEQVDALYACLRTPVDQVEPEGPPCVLPANVPAAPRRIIMAPADMEIPVPSRITLIGFAVTWAVVGMILLLSLWLFRL